MAPCLDVSGVPDDVASEADIDTSFYTKHCSVFGIPVLGSDNVDDDVIKKASRLAADMLKDRNDVRDAMHDRFLRILIAARMQGETLRDLPDLVDLERSDYAGVGPTPFTPIVAAHDRDVICRQSTYETVRPGNAFVHEIGHAIHLMGMNFVDPTFDERLKSAFLNATKVGLWRVVVPADLDGAEDLPALTSRDLTGNDMERDYLEYWAHGVEIWFQRRSVQVAVRWVDGESGPILAPAYVGTRAQLRERAPDLYALLGEAFPSGFVLEPICAGS